MLSNAYFLVNFRFDTAENELAKHLQNLAINFCKYLHCGNHRILYVSSTVWDVPELAAEHASLSANEEGPFPAVSPRKKTWRLLQISKIPDETSRVVTSYLSCSRLLK